MANKTAFLDLTLPLNGEFTDNWDSPNNANFEALDDHLLQLNTDLVGVGGDTITLKGSAADLQSRIDIGLGATGALLLSANADFIALELSKVRPKSGASDQLERIKDRFDSDEVEAIELRQHTYVDRWGSSTGTKSSTVGVGKSAAGAEVGSSSPVRPGMNTPNRGFTPNCVVSGVGTPGSGTTPYVPGHMAIDSGQAKVVGPVVYNIDGVYFEIANDLRFDFASLPVPPGAGTYYMFVDRLEGNYNGASGDFFPYSHYNGATLGGSFMLDPRIIPTNAVQRLDASSAVNPADGTTTVSTSNFSSATGEFLTLVVKAGDILVITASPDASLVGEYVIAADATANTTLTVDATFPATASTSTFYVARRTMPSLGYSQLITKVAGRVYIAEAVVNGSNVVTALTPYMYNGVYDTDWLDFPSINAFINAKPHYLGTWPSQVEIWVRNTGTDDSYMNPTVLLAVENVSEAGGAPAGTKDVPFPAFRWKANATVFSVSAFDVMADTTVFTDFTGSVDILNDGTPGTHEFRVILRR